MKDATLTRRAFLGLGAAASLAACGGGGSPSGGGNDDGVSIIMVTGTGGVYDQSFNQLSWEGLQRLAADTGWKVSYIESKQESEFFTNLDKAVDAEPKLIWGIGFDMADALNSIADDNPENQFAGMDITNNQGVGNLTGVTFKSEESSFAVGYIAARMTKTGKVGFLGGIESDTLLAFRCGYLAGVEYANKEQGTSVAHVWQMAESFSDAAKGKSIAQKMIEEGADVIYTAAGQSGTGGIEACQEAGVYAIGVDMDQSYLAPKTIITSALKCVDEAVYYASKELVDGTTPSGQNFALGVAEEAVGIAETHDLLPDEVYEAALGVLALIKAGDIVVPATEAGLADYVASL